MNDDVKIDDSFKLSFIADIAKGMEYIHKSHLVSHGNLKSSNCLVDGRWMIRVGQTLCDLNNNKYIIHCFLAIILC